jgi:hypothetical protein
VHLPLRLNTNNPFAQILIKIIANITKSPHNNAGIFVALVHQNDYIGMFFATA